jgi:hypothetical protein
MTLEESIESVISEIESNLPKLSQADFDRYASLKDRLDAMAVKKSTLPDGVYEVGFNKEYLSLVREVLMVYKDLIVPELIRQETRKLRGVAKMAKAFSNG